MLAGCSADDLPASKLGNTSDLLVTTPEAPPPRIPVTGPDGVDPFLIGEWVGHAEDLFASSDDGGQRPTYVFPSGSSEIYLSLDIRDGAHPFGELRFGSRDAPEPQVGVPLGAGNEYYYSIFDDAGEMPIAPVEGVAYALAETVPRVGLSDPMDNKPYSALGLSYSPRTAFETWCPLQPSLPYDEDRFSCSGAAGFAGGDPGAGIPCIIFRPDGSEQEMDCDLLTLCEPYSGPCECTESGCAAKDDGPREILWVAREGDQLIAHATDRFEYGEPGHQMPIGAIRFDRVAP
jgi:hypothetical protein